MVGFCSIDDAFPGFSKDKRNKKEDIYLNDNVKLSKRISNLEKREFVDPERTVKNNIDYEVNAINKKLFEDLDNKYKVIVEKLTGEINNLKDQLFTCSNSNKEDIVEGYSLDVQNDQFNELMLYICTCIFFIFLFDYMFTFGKRCY
uniref:Uncharacterized protein n=1 Tax=viral metagenome TaxID=1070528 RepID=A0A6C0CZM1_9ZZZZ